MAVPEIVEASIEACPPWLFLLAGFGLGAMTKQSLRRLLRLVGRGATGQTDGESS